MSDHTNVSGVDDPILASQPVLDLKSDPEIKPEPGGILSPSFQGLLWTNWLTAINDNIFRWFVIGVGKTFVAPQYHGRILMFGTVCFVLPYILFASPAGWLADRFRKRNVIIACKVAEIIVMTLGVISLLCGSIYMLMFTVALMGAQSALFAPSKIGTIPELLSEEEISKGNGIFALATLSAVVIGMGAGNKLADVAGVRGEKYIWLTALILVGVAVLGTLISFLIRARAAANPKAAFPKNFLLETWRDIVDLSTRGPLFRVALGTVFFLAIAGLAQLNIDAFADESGSITESEKFPLLVSLVLGLGVGSVVAGLASGNRIELGLVPIGAFGMFAFMVALAFTPENFITGNIFGSGQALACMLLAGLGISAGFFDVPLNSYLQHKSPVAQRGRILSATNCLMFAGIALFSFGLDAMRTATHETETSGLESSRIADSVTAEQREQILAAAEATEISSLEDSDAVTRINNLNPIPESEPAARLYATNELIYHDAKARISADETVIASDYAGLFDESEPNDKRKLKSILLRASKLPLLSSRQIFLLMGIGTIPVFLFALWRLSREAMRLIWVFMLKCIYRVKITGMENLPQNSGGALVANHSNWLDGVIFLTFIPQPFRVIAWAGNFNNSIMKKWAEFCRVILIGGGPKSIRKAFKDSRAAVDNGELLGIFAEGGISPSCQVRTLKPGLLKILQDRKVPIIPVYIDEVWGSIFSYADGKAIWKWPRSIRRPISITIGKPVEPHPESMLSVQTSLQRLSAEAVSNYVGPFRSPVVEFVKSCRIQRKTSKIADSLGSNEKGGMLLTRALILRRLLRKFTLEKDEQNVGVLIPPTVAGAIANLSLALDKRVAINLNYSLSNELINHCIHEAGIKRVLTTRMVMEKFSHLELDCELVYLDDFKEKVTGMDKAIGALMGNVLPAGMVCSLLGLNSIKADDLMTIVFTSGSTGVPKGVMLSHQNIHSNVRGFEKAAQFQPTDTIVGILPYFHSFGYTITLWGAMMCNVRGAYHVNPLDAKQVGKLVKRQKGTILMSTPTFLRTYMRRCKPEQFATLDAVVTGAERLPPELADQYEEKFGVRPVQGYGITELSPGVSANIPESRRRGDIQVEAKEGTVGRPIANVTAKVCDLDTNEELPANQSGMLWIKGPNVMLGYLNKEEATREVIVDSWFKTGDMAMIDEDGFITITGRLSRFSKIGGEMIPHLKIEEVLSKLLDRTPDDDSDDELHVAVTAVPDEKKGERLVVLYTTTHTSPDEMRQALTDAGLPNIFVPSTDSFHKVDSLPLLGTGKLDLKGIKETAAAIYDIS
ncbi:MFS transporter [Mariniblastus fucicola]|uniref:Bifunctional protein Aas n=1 Tax=Mariniblastus fucicola TaxID=980251 RepID=A0A5B9P8C0_9BACT|nr:MFS transporter [Mariniblastus fucicola]QEG20866.1 Bifunctional protein Aas [Mariniblastus fucicola]